MEGISIILVLVALGRTLKIFAGKLVISFGRNRTCDLLLIDIGDRIEMDRDRREGGRQILNVLLFLDNA